KNILTENKAKLAKVAEYLIINEAVEGEALNALFGEGMPEVAPVAPTPAPTASPEPEAAKKRSPVHKPSSAPHTAPAS
ncbi:MAG: hypothetical protein Q7T04_05750, partial [Dehalococcoidia bacterium]|nr:hypothetical protein [Dehalococcoidia bacterium]